MNQLVADTSGAGPAVVLLHGQPGSRGDWAQVTRRLDSHFLVVAPDRPGYGQTGGRARGFRGNAAAVVALLDRLGVTQATMVGYSWAGGVALALAQQAPERVSGVVLVSSVGPEEPLTRLDRMLAMPPIGTAVTVAGLLLASTALSIPPVRRAVQRRQGRTTATSVIDPHVAGDSEPATAGAMNTLTAGAAETIASRVAGDSPQGDDAEATEWGTEVAGVARGAGVAGVARGAGAGREAGDDGTATGHGGDPEARLRGPAPRDSGPAGDGRLPLPNGGRPRGPGGPDGPIGYAAANNHDGAVPVTVLTSWRSNRVWRSFVTEQQSLIDELPLLAPGLAAIRVPTVVLVGEADRVVRPAAGRGLARRIPGARLVEVGGAGHLLAFYHPDAVAAAVREVTPH